MSDTITIKLSTDADRDRVERLAQLDGGHAPTGEVLLAEVNGRLLAAVGMDGSAVADPFERTAGVVRLLRTQLTGRREPRMRRGRRLGRRLGRLLPV
jgi:hypothetical protein